MYRLFSTFYSSKYVQIKLEKFFFFLESIDTGLSANVSMKEIVIKLTMLLGGIVRNEKTHFKMLLVTNVLRVLYINILNFPFSLA